MPHRERFTERDARAILKRAAERQHRADLSAEARANGLSLTDLERAAAAAGIDPEHVAGAIRDAERVEPETEPGFTDRMIGKPTSLRRQRVIPGRLDEALWQKLVLELRRTFDTAGTPSTLGALHEWRSDSHHSKNFGEFQAEEVDGEVHLTLRRSWTTPASGTAAWLVLGGVMAPFFLLLGTQNMPMGGAIIGAILSVLASVLAFALTRGWYRSFIDKEANRSDQLMERLDGIVTKHTQAHELEAARAALEEQAGARSASVEHPTSAARLDLDEVAGEPGSSASARASRSQQRT
ncbi:MAG: hypothetical protein AAFQ86_04240 [Bacteroidota bacterium]